MKRFLVLFIFIILIGNIFAICDEGQMDINSASMEELDKITGIGEVYAERIIEARPFGSVDDLLDVNGIGEKTLEKIKAQGLACVSDEVEDSVEEIEKIAEEVEVKVKENLVQDVDVKEELQPIILNSKSIKSEEDKTNLGKNLAFGGILTFCVVFGSLFFIKTRKRKNEFR